MITLNNTINMLKTYYLEKLSDTGFLFGYDIEELNTHGDSDKVFMISYYIDRAHYPPGKIIMYFNQDKNCVAKFDCNYKSLEFTDVELKILDIEDYILCGKHEIETGQDVGDWVG